MSSCSAEGSRGSVRCSGATTCVAGRCLSAGQRCNPGTRDNCGPAGMCAVANWEAEEGLCIVQEMNRVAIGGNCEDTAQCSDGSVCLALQAGQPKSCLGICRPAGGGAVSKWDHAGRSRSSARTKSAATGVCASLRTRRRVRA